jgi:AcrR family transcriptional regulator
MARPPTIRDETIIQAAREVFLARGIRATTAEVAERAGVSEGSIFKRFKSKLELFEAAMGSPEEDPAFIRDLDRRVGQGDIRESLYELGREIESHFRRAVPLVMMSWSNRGPEAPPCGSSGATPPPIRILKALIGYFEAEMRLGRLRSIDPEVAARSFFGAIQNFVVFEVLFGPQPDLHLQPEPYLRALVQLAWTGLAPLEPAGRDAVRLSGNRAPL